MMIHLTPRQLRIACDAWQMGGHLALGLWAAHAGLKDWGVIVYGEVVQAVREELIDDTDYMVAEYEANEPARARRRRKP